MKKVLKVLLVLILIVLVGFCYYLLRVKSFDINKNVYIDEKDKVEDLVDLAVEKGTPVLRDAAEELRVKAIAVTKDVLRKLEKEEKK